MKVDTITSAAMNLIKHHGAQLEDLSRYETEDFIVCCGSVLEAAEWLTIQWIEQPVFEVRRSPLIQIYRLPAIVRWNLVNYVPGVWSDALVQLSIGPGASDFDESCRDALDFI